MSESPTTPTSDEPEENAEQATSEQATPDTAPADEAMADEATPDEATPDEATPDEATPEYEANPEATDAPPTPGTNEDATVVSDDPGGQMTSTGEQIVDNDVSDDEFEALLEGTMKVIEEGKIVEGIVVRVDPDEVLLDFQYKSEGVIPARELSIKMDIDPNEVVATGDLIEALVMNKEDEEGRVVLSKKRAQYERAWGTIERIYNEDSTVIGTVIEVVKGGLILDIGLRGFLPASLVEMRRVRDLGPYVGTQLECKIIELDRNRNNVVLSRRKFLEETQSEFRSEFLESLQKGEIREGVVSSIVNFGAFVDLGGVDGLVHVSELSWQHIDHPSEVVEVGDKVRVEVLDVDLQRERVSLSLKATQEDPWNKFAREHGTGEIVEGEVTKLVPFGAFVKVADGIEGLIHISELADRHVEVPEAVVNVGDQVDVKVIDIDTERRRISLSLKQAGGPDTGGESGDAVQYRDEPQVSTAYSSGGDDTPAGGSSAMAAAFASAGLAGDDAPSPEEMALAEAELPDQVEGAEAGEPADEADEADEAEAADEAAPEASDDDAGDEADEADEADDASDDSDDSVDSVDSDDSDDSDDADDADDAADEAEADEEE